MAQNIHDNNEFFETYSRLPGSLEVTNQHQRAPFLLVAPRRYARCSRAGEM
jgi:hypothetical protein